MEIKKFFLNKALVYSITTIGFSVLFQLIFLRYVAYYVDKSDYGNYVLIQTLLMFLYMFFLQIPLQSFDRFFNETDNTNRFINQFLSIVV